MPQRTHPFLSLSSKSSGVNLDVSGLGTLWSVPQRGCPSVSRHRSIQAAAPPGHLLLKQAAIWYSLTVYFGLNYRVGERAPKVCQKLQGFFFLSSFLSFQLFNSVGKGKRNAFRTEFAAELPGFRDLCKGHCFCKGHCLFMKTPAKHANAGKPRACQMFSVPVTCSSCPRKDVDDLWSKGIRLVLFLSCS